MIEEMINVAAGEKLSFSQEEITFSGHAIECRINAEIAEENFRPTPENYEMKSRSAGD